AELDLVVVPSTWVENQPIVIREALAAGRPVVASRVGALPESVREGVDGWLFEPGAAGDLARVLRRLIEAPGEVRRVAAALEPVVDVDAHARELAALYAELVARRPARDDAGLPAHVRAIAAEHAELAALPARELYERVLHGLERLAPVLGIEPPSPAELLGAAFGGRSRAQEFIDDGAGERAWHAVVRESAEREANSLRERLAWRERTLEERDAQLAWLRSNQEGLENERKWLRETLEALERERAWLREQVEDRDRALAWRADQLGGLEREAAWRREQVEAFEVERAWLREEVAARDFQLGWMREDLGARLADLERAHARLAERLARCDELARAADELLAARGASAESLRRAAAQLRDGHALLRRAAQDFLAAVPRSKPAPAVTPEDRSAPPTGAA
ncbi:MAG: glycosyltransferase, partial [Planctomycetota bacterium]